MGKEYVEQRDGGYYVAGTRISLDSIVHAFVRGESPEAICQNFELLRLEVLLSSCIPPLKVEDFYLFDLPNSNPDLLPVAILKSYLQKNGEKLELKKEMLSLKFSFPILFLE